MKVEHLLLDVFYDFACDLASTWLLDRGLSYPGEDGRTFIWQYRINRVINGSSERGEFLPVWQNAIDYLGVKRRALTDINTIEWNRSKHLSENLYVDGHKSIIDFLVSTDHAWPHKTDQSFVALDVPNDLALKIAITGIIPKDVAEKLLVLGIP